MSYLVMMNYYSILIYEICKLFNLMSQSSQIRIVFISISVNILNIV